MSLPFTSVVSYHQNPMTCGVAKFSAELAKRLGVPFVGLDGYPWGEHPLLSVKCSEVEGDYAAFGILRAFSKYQRSRPYSVFWHDAGDSVVTKDATHVFYADPSLGSPGLWCPSLITPRKRPVRLFSFGMASKLQPEKYRRVRELLDAASIRYHLRVSVGLHEGTSLDGAEKHFDALKEIMGPEHVTILGILSDDAVSEELSNADYVLAFFEKGVRANNTTVHAAIEHGCGVITNKDTDTPRELDLQCWDIDAPYLPFNHPWKGGFTWDSLIEAMKGICERSPSTAA